MTRLIHVCGLALIVGGTALGIGDTLTAAQGRIDPRPSLVRDVRRDVSPRLRDVPLRPPRPDGRNREIPIKRPARFADRGGPATFVDPAQQPPTSFAAPAPLLSFDGVSDDDNAALLGYRVVPPDTQGDVGPSHYVQWTNLLFAVYDKATGQRLLLQAGKAVWSGFGGACENENDGDPIVLYDHLADRWLITQFAINTDGYQCLAVSTTGDPTGAYYRYEFLVAPGGFDDYPKFGLWPDGYYMSANEFVGGNFQGAVLIAFNRHGMLNGEPGLGVKFGPLPCFIECYFGLQPSDLDGPPPAVGTPNTFIQAWDDQVFGFGGSPDGYRLFDFAVNWVAPETSTLSYKGHVAAPAFDANLCNFNACIAQPRPGERLDALSQFTMYRAQYRFMGSHGALVLNHTVDTARDHAGIRWTELRNQGAGWKLHQTGTYAPDRNDRWMGSIAMDEVGNIALGYSVSGAKLYPSIRYTTRSVGDPLGVLGTETTLQAGAGAQVGSYNRWGDYSTMSVDPVDDCTFWYTQEYYGNTGSFDFKTRIASFKMPGCS